jgi:cytosine/adenosine deaminase-related metal-dependent hydrolase
MLRPMQACRPSAVPASIHLGEDPSEVVFSRDGAGPFAGLLDELGIDWRWWTPSGLRPVAYLDALSVLGPGLLLVHGVDLDADDRARMVARGSPLCLCPRSNLHIGGRLPDVPALLAAGVHLCVGTDSLASSPDLDVLAEIAVLARAFRTVPIERWLRMATSGGADALGFPSAGRIAVGASPGLVLLHVDDPRDLASGPAPRTWKVRS